MKYFKESPKERSVSVSMSDRMYLELLHGRKKTEETPAIRGCGTPDKLVEYVDQAWGLLGTVSEVLTA